MPRQSRSRPAARSSSSSSSSPFGSSSGQTRQASTAAYPPQAQSYGGAYPQQAQAQQRQPGLLAQMAATASSVAVGSTVGHGLSNMLFGGRSEAPVEQQQAPPQQQYAPQNSGLSCDFQAKEFTKCMENGDINTCGWYLDQLKACQAAARPY
ncbi:Mitochondrial intermembrane space cysteine motif-containing protein MIC17 OS=Saccharomyces cerevisiae (strain ATCC 204508 / S288c) GN=MIC17 PE=1 SV=1 [Rhizoctonia solani AG-1 IB]|uniref:MIC17 protein n=1 Tax=Thanatephorus cucumeris (strain AG1-IB / isolate 7/3/14) TaxID=1108050 RepID=M5BU13_THACB|nr:Mitochondrial intermembrane space cysteine motif-containing protein MIC17 AltName: Full=Mitochondrial intermembrane space cysteine motif-containing protein of 17 kDa [Rhizoctonia solani AG-1 IB]CEL57335.1 Mitochondrial intermembrane space cysteine motif-containing protein MIC17 OS=Saccharomyces cerevisiae (strain ATCC 204508 / S288c) GN=MIC17 PE=1 SV=1 [Rhizoctonia solani AG-1 IB]